VDDDIAVLRQVEERPNKRRKGKITEIPYIVKHEAKNYWINPKAFSFTKQDKQGYPTIPFKLNAALASQLQPKSTTAKSTWIPRLMLHSVVWRWANDYAQIPPGTQVSHLGDDPHLVSPEALVLESGVVNRSRSPCLQEGWHTQLRGGTYTRCPHEPVCRPAPPRPSPTVFEIEELQPPGLPIRDRRAEKASSSPSS